MSRSLPVAALMAGTALLVPTAQGEPSASFYSGLSYTSGDYGFDEDTTVTRLPLGVSLNTGRLTLFGEAAYISADGYVAAIQQSSSGTAASRLRGRLGLSDGETEDPPQSVSGWGDLVIGASLRLSPSPADYYAGLTFTTSAPTGDEEQGLGTGDWSWSASLDGEKRWNDLTLSGSVGGVLLGDAAGSTAGDNDNTLEESYAFASLRAGYDVSTALTTGLSLSWAQSSDTAFDDQLEAVLTAGWRLSDTVYLGSYASAGLTDSSPDFGAGFTLSLTPTPRGTR